MENYPHYLYLHVLNILRNRVVYILTFSHSASIPLFYALTYFYEINALNYSGLISSNLNN